MVYHCTFQSWLWHVYAIPFDGDLLDFRHARIMKRSIRQLSFLIAFLFCMDATAQSWLWARQPVFMGSESSDGEGIALATDPSGNVYETGYFSYATMQYGTDVFTATNANLYLVKYDTSGNLLWATDGIVHSALGGQSQGYSVSTDLQGNVFVTGFFSDTLVLGSFTLVATLANSIEMFIVKYDPSGNVKWARQSKARIWTGYPNWGMGCATDKNGNVYVTGNFSDTTAFGAISLISPINYFGDVFLVKYDSAGNVLWARQGDMPSTNCNSVGNGVTTDAFGNVYITGGFQDSLSFGSTTLTNSFIAGDIFLAKFDQNGVPLWARQSVNHSHNNYNYTRLGGNSVAADRLGNVYIAGNFDDTVSFGTDTLMNGMIAADAAPYGDMFLAKYDSSGNVVWAKQGEPITRASYNGYGIVTDTFNHLYFTGTAVNDSNEYNKLDFSLKFGRDTFTITGSGTPSLECSFMVQLDVNGNVLCGAAIPLGGDDWSGIATDPSGRFVYMGSDYFVQYSSVTIGSSTLGPYNGALNSANEIPFVARWSPCNPVIPLSAIISKTDVSCNGLCNGTATADPSNGTPPYRYLWNTAPVDTTSVITGLCAGSYIVTVTDHNGDTATTGVTIIQPVAVVIKISVDKDTLCAGDTSMLSVTGSAGVQWQSSTNGVAYTNIPGATDSLYTAVALQSAVYRAVTGNGVCPDTSLPQGLVVNALPVPILTAVDSIICSGDSTQVCALGGYSYVWNTGASGDCIYALNAGGYWVTATDTNGCSVISGHRLITAYPTPSVSIVVQGDTLYSFNSVSYQWILNDSIITGATQSVYIARRSGEYAVQIVDSDGCMAVSNNTVVVVNGINEITEGSLLSVYPDPFTGPLYIRFSGPIADEYEITFYNVLGEKIAMTRTTELSSGPLPLDVSTLPPGLYYLRIGTGNADYIRPVVKE